MLCFSNVGLICAANEMSFAAIVLVVIDVLAVPVTETDQINLKSYIATTRGTE